MVDVSKGTQLYQGRWRWLGILAHDHSEEATGASFKGLGPRYWGSESSWVQEGSARAVSHQNCTRRIVTSMTMGASLSGQGWNV